MNGMPARFERFETAPGFDFGEFFFMDAEGDPWSVQEGDGVDAVDVAHARGEHLWRSRTGSASSWSRAM
jgi:hypothetical protein